MLTRSSCQLVYQKEPRKWGLSRALLGSEQASKTPSKTNPVMGLGNNWIWSIKRIESSKINPSVYGQLIPDQVSRHFTEETIVFSTNGAGSTTYPHVKEWNCPLPTAFRKITWNGSKPNWGAKNIKPLEETQLQHSWKSSLRYIFIAPALKRHPV